ncbi:MAG: PIN domain-containing protein [Chthoniobacterales bacterium]
METVIETSVWIDLFRAKTSAPVRAQIKPWVGREDLALCEPLLYELLRNAATGQRSLIQRHLATIPVLSTPPMLWTDAIELGQRCCSAGLATGALDLLIAAICIHHDAELIAFDKQFAGMAKLSRLRCQIFERAS